MTTKPTVEKKVSKPSTKEIESTSKRKDKCFLIPHNPLLFHSKEVED